MSKNWSLNGNVAGISDQFNRGKRDRGDTNPSVVNVNDINIRIDAESTARANQGQVQAQEQD
ncbi:hypothetical protein [Sutcliffiella sp. NC1]|uniref:hypothetical protein n=1 Tax=Sutcliffiella sp. NC1 TaxID=3004096 RepID=UPI0022DDE70D|nr:hypothetical protein [Sutcliffiella sp. NC1]WBL16285.1 hypothetical protein O1A01_06545 [Sutcliffiella sp. NC1]